MARQVAQKLGLSHIPLDAIVSAFQDNFPEHGIVHHELELAAICSNFLPFLTSFLEELEFEGTSFCVDSYHILPDGAAKLKSQLGIVPIFFGYPDVSWERKLADIRAYPEKNDWTAEFDDEHMRPLVERFIDQSRYIQSECARLELPFVDSGPAFLTSLDDAVKRIIAGACAQRPA